MMGDYAYRGYSSPEPQGVATNTASIHRLPGKGTIEIGYDADFCLIDLNREVKVKLLHAPLPARNTSSIKARAFVLPLQLRQSPSRDSALS